MTSTVPLSHSICNQTFLLLPQKAIFWKERQALILADVHLGKVGHFRKAGIAIPRSMEQEDLAMLSDLIQHYKPRSVIFLGDLFHSDMNNDWDWFVMWRELYKEVEMVLVRGNHDILHDSFYSKLGFALHDSLELGPFLLLHRPLTEKELSAQSQYVLCGHIHPGVKLKGKGRQSVTLPCFHFGPKQAIIPAFGVFTGKVGVRCEEDDTVFAVLKHKVMAV